MSDQWFWPSVLLFYIQISKQKKVYAAFYLIFFLITWNRGQIANYILSHQMAICDQTFCTKRVLLEVSTLSIADRLIVVDRSHG